MSDLMSMVTKSIVYLLVIKVTQRVGLHGEV